MEVGNQVTDQWSELKECLLSVEVDVYKNAKGNCAAGVRVRKALRELTKKASKLVKLTVVLDKERRATKPKKQKKSS